MADYDTMMDEDGKAGSRNERKGRGHSLPQNVEERYGRARFSELDPKSPIGPTPSIEGWVVFVTGVHEEAQASASWVVATRGHHATPAFGRNAQEEDLHEAFSEFGEVKNIYMNLDRQTGFVKGYALIEYKKKTEAQAAINAMNGAELLTQKIKVDYAFKKGDIKRGGNKARR